MTLPFLEKIGLTVKEAEIYEFLLKKGEITAGPIIVELNLKRATVYKSLYALEEKGLISKRDIEKKIHFKPEAPTKLLELAEVAHHEQERAREDLRTMIPELNLQYFSSVEKPIVTTFEGFEGMKKIYMDTIHEGKPIYAALQTFDLEPAIIEWLESTYLKLRLKHTISADVIVASGSWAKTYVKADKKYLRKTIIVPKERFPFQHEINIYGDKVAFIHQKKGSTMIGIVINHPLIAQTMKALFDLAWKGSEQLEG